MATGAAFKNGFDSFIDRFDRAQTQEVALAQAVQAARMQVAQENRFRAGLNVQAQLQQSQEQRMLDNQAFANFRNQLQAPVDVQLAANNTEIQRQFARELPILSAASQARVGTNAQRALTENAIARGDAAMLSNLTGFKFKKDPVLGRLVYTDPNGQERDFRGSPLELTMIKEKNALLEQQAKTGYFQDLIYGRTLPPQTNTPSAPQQQDPSMTLAEDRRLGRQGNPTQKPTQAATPMADSVSRARAVDNSSLKSTTENYQPNIISSSQASTLVKPESYNISLVDAAQKELDAVKDGAPSMFASYQEKMEYKARLEQAEKSLKAAKNSY